MSDKGITYKDAGVDIDTGNELAAKYTELMESTFGSGVVRNDGGFGGLFSLKGLSGQCDFFSRFMDEPILVAGADGVGTKLKLAFMLKKHDTVGIDLVAMSVNDVLVQGAQPLFFLDYIGTGRCDKDTMLGLVTGVAEGCRQSGCALLGGETAEMPGFYPEGEYDLAGFAVGIVERAALLDGSQVASGDVILGLASSGLHSNGFSLARKALFEVGGYSIDSTLPELEKPLGETLLEPTRIYVKPVMKALELGSETPLHGLVHITGGGITENTPRILPADCNAEIKLGSWDIPPIFKVIQAAGNIAEEEMYRVFNMGIGMLVICPQASAEKISATLQANGEAARIIGRVTPGNGEVSFV